MYWLVQNFKMVVFCEYDIVGLDHKLLDISLYISVFVVHLEMFEKYLPLFLGFFHGRVLGCMFPNI